VPLGEKGFLETAAGARPPNRDIRGLVLKRIVPAISTYRHRT